MNVNDDVVRWMVPEYIPTCNAIYLFSSPLLQWRQFIGWVRKSDNGARVARNKEKKRNSTVMDSLITASRNFRTSSEVIGRDRLQSTSNTWTDVRAARLFPHVINYLTQLLFHWSKKETWSSLYYLFFEVNLITATILVKPLCCETITWKIINRRSMAWMAAKIFYQPFACFRFIIFRPHIHTCGT